MLLGVNILLPDPDVLEALGEGAGFREAFPPDAATLPSEDREE